MMTERPLLNECLSLPPNHTALQCLSTGMVRFCDEILLLLDHTDSHLPCACQSDDLLNCPAVVSHSTNLSYVLLLLQEFFENPAFRPDGMKLYPTLVIRGTGLYELWKTGRYKSYPPSTLVDLVARILALVPPWTRVYRVQR